MALPTTPMLNNNAVPSALGRYEILGALARGGMATVYLGRHSGEAGFKRLYAIKVLHAHLADDTSFVEMLLDEARIAASLHHPNIVPIVDLGTQDGSHYVVMEYIEGCSLAMLLTKDRNARSPRLIVPIMLDALAGLHAAHSLTDDDGTVSGLVHRDVSPQNILVGVDGSARITDFGIAKATSKINSTQPGQLKGKLAFMAPEQLKNASNVDARTDVFAAGALLWSALTGRRLFLGASDAETLNNILTLEVQKPSTVGFQPPAALDDVCLRALERDPDKRFQTAAEMEDALRVAAESAQALGTKREVADWIASRFGTELAERRSAVRGADSRPSSSSSVSQVSGFRMIPSIGTNTSLTPSGATAPSPIIDEIPVFHSADGGKPDIAKKATARVIYAVGAAIIVVLALVGLRLREPAAAATAATTTTTVATANGAPNGAVVTPTATATAAATAPLATGSAVAPAATTAAAQTATAATAAAHVPPARPAFVAAPARPAFVAAPAPAPQPTAAPKKKTWDPDSPLPPQ